MKASGIKYEAPSKKEYTMKWDGRCWCLSHEVEGINVRTKEPTVSTQTTYHANIEQCASKIITLESSECKDLKEMVALYKKTIKEVEKLLSS